LSINLGPSPCPPEPPCFPPPPPAPPLPPCICTDAIDKSWSCLTYALTSKMMMSWCA
jgi:hypothetical protein